ncbi:MAG: hypothetical protein WCA55_07270, partial [Xanthobacteraceae bacterium]
MLLAMFFSGLVVSWIATVFVMDGSLNNFFAEREQLEAERIGKLYMNRTNAKDSDLPAGLPRIPDRNHPNLYGQPQEQHMYRTVAAVLISMLFAAPASAQSACEALALSKDGKPLAGAAKTAFVT